MRVLGVAGVRRLVVDLFLSDHVAKMRRLPELVLLIGFDSHKERLNDVQARIPQDLIDPVFTQFDLNFEPQRHVDASSRQGRLWP